MMSEMAQRINDMVKSMKEENQALRLHMFRTMKEETNALRKDMNRMWEWFEQHQQTNKHPPGHRPHSSAISASDYRQPSSHHQRDDLYESSPEPQLPPSQDYQITTRIQQNKAFKQALNSTTSKFNGSDAQEYVEWKRSFQLETSDLKLNSTQMLQLLEARTEKEPQQIVKNLRYVKIDIGHDYDLQMAWECLDQRY